MAPQRFPFPNDLPRKRVAAGALLLDDQRRILLVNPTYKPQWEIPGGMVEGDESPLAACRREVWEEIGLTIAPGVLLSVGYIQGRKPGNDAIRFIFWGGLLDQTMIAQIRLPATELSEYRLVTLDEAAVLVRPSLHAQLAQCLANLSDTFSPSTLQTYWEEA